MEKIVFSIVTIVVGMFIGLHLAMNGSLGLKMSENAGSSFKGAATANLFFWIIGSFIAIVYYFVFSASNPFATSNGASKPLFLAGAIGASLVFAITYLIPSKTGGANLGFIYLVVGQILIGLILSHFGFLGSPQDPISMKKVIGVVVIAIGIYISVL